jgi:ribonuclease T2
VRCHRDLTCARRSVGVLAAALMVMMSSGWRAEAAGRDVGARPPGQFDYYVLSLSWVPGFCATHRRHPPECGRGLGFALHGLWPQFNGGDYPTDCSAAGLTPSEIQRYSGLYATPSLIAHEWPKHGTCSGLQPAAYFALSARDMRRIRIPAAYGSSASLSAADANAVKSALIIANPGLPLFGMTVVASRGVLTEVDICLTKNGNFRPC